MGSLFKRKDSQYWWCAIKSAGKWVSLSTKETNKNKARDFMVRKEGDASKGFNVHAYDKTTLKDLKEAVFRSYREKGNRTIDKVEQNFKHLDPFFGDIPVVAINQSVIAQYKEHILKTTKLAKTSINRHLATLRHGLNLLHADDMIARVPKIRMYKEDNARQVYLTWPEIEKLVSAAEKHKPYLAPVIQTAVQTGLRKSAILGMQWKHIDSLAGVRFHDLRRSCISLLSQTGSTDGEMMNLMGIKSSQTLHRYDIVGSRRRMDVLRRRQAFLEEQTDNVVPIKRKAAREMPPPCEIEQTEAEAEAFRKSLKSSMRVGETT